MEISVNKLKEMLGNGKKSIKSTKSQGKYGNIRTKREGINFHSKLEADFYSYLLEEKRRGFVEYFLMQVPFILPGNVKYLVDFQIFNEDLSVEYVDTKGVMTPMSNLKIKQVEDLYPVKIKIVKRGDF
ncbi:MAG: DUF1064 domain-containing protein [Bacteroidota bacterium]